MSDALEEAHQGAAEGGIPIGAALVDTEGNLVATGRNRRIQDRSMVMHAEINCLHNAGRTMNSIQGMTMYSTLMPCNMCAGAIVQFGITKVITAESENFAENNGLDLMLRNGVEIIDLDQAEAKELLRKFIERNPREWHGDIGQDPGRASTGCSGYPSPGPTTSGHEDTKPARSRGFEHRRRDGGSDFHHARAPCGLKYSPTTRSSPSWSTSRASGATRWRTDWGWKRGSPKPW